MSQSQSSESIIVDYYESLIGEVNIYTKELVEKFNEDDLLPLESEPYERYTATNEYISELETVGYSYETRNIVANESTTKIRDYLDVLRENAISEILKAKQHNLDSYKTKGLEIDSKNEEKIEELKSQLFADMFCFLLKIDQYDFDDLYLIICDFYLSSREIDYIRSQIDSDKIGGNNFAKKYPKTKFNERLLLANQLTQYISGLLCTRRLGFELIYIDRETLLEINDIYLYNWNFNGFNLSKIDSSAIKSLSITSSCNNRLEDLSSFQNIESLNLFGLDLCGNPFANLRNLAQITFRECDFFNFNLNSLNYLSSLKCIQIVDCYETRIDFTCFENLKWLELSFVREPYFSMANLSNEADFLKISVFLGKYPQKIDDFFNRLKLPQLKYLTILHDDLPRLNDNWFIGLDHLKCLNLSRTQINNLDFIQSGYLNNLEELDLSLNQITSINKGAFSKLNKLKHLSLSGNMISELNPGIFKGLEDLEFLHMKNVGWIEKIERDVFIGLRCLKEMDLSYNGLVFIHHEAFTHLETLERLDLSANSLNLERRLFAPLKHLKWLDFRGNDVNNFDTNSLERIAIN